MLVGKLVTIQSLGTRKHVFQLRTQFCQKNKMDTIPVLGVKDKLEGINEDNGGK